ncbi:hypothetical protein [Jannaschia sp. R86511]|uniref:hypothetical protein n=1 Tax=Jannaschia sp. R86511 TaxID=3093853 RepID=UPI0036D3A86B
MVYSLTNASALGLDLARTPGGAEAAGVLLRGLLAPPPAAAGPAPVRAPVDLPPARTRAWALVGPGGPTVVDVTDRAAEAADADGDELARTLRRMLRRLGAVSFGTVADLTALAADLATELPAGAAARRPTGAGDAAPQVLDADVVRRGELLADALLAAVVVAGPDPAGPVLARALRHRLDPPAPQPPALPPAPAPGDAVRGRDPVSVTGPTADLLGALAAVDDPTRLLLTHGPAPHVWAEHMHSAAWAVETTGRTRVAAAAQLDLVRCLAAAGVTPAHCLAGVWNTCSAAVQAHVVADVLGADSWTVLTADLLEALEHG